jgi:hypothetical protein
LPAVDQGQLAVDALAPRCTRAASSSRIAFFATRPISMITPMKLIRFSVPRVSSRASTTPIRLSGRDSITPAAR